MKKLLRYFNTIFALIILCGYKSFGADVWERINSPANSVAYSLYSTENGLLLMGSGQGINWSSDRGENWTSAESENEMAHLIMDFAEDSKGALYAGGAEGLFRSTDEGRYWELIKETRMAEIIKIDEEDNIYLVTFVEQMRPKLLFSSNSGKNWSDRTPEFDSSGRFKCGVIRSDLVIAAVDNGLLFSKDKGITWEKVSGVPDTAQITCIVPTDSAIVVNTFYDDKNTGMYRSSDGSVWQKVNTTPDTANILLLTYNPTYKELYAIPWEPGVLRSLDDGTSWTDYGQGLPANEYISEIIASSDGFIYASGSTNLYRRRTNSSTFDEKEANSEDADVKVYQFDENIRIELPSAYSQLTAVDLFDMHGRRAQASEFKRISETAIELELLGVNPGFYLLRIQTEKKAYVKSLVIPGI